MSSDERKVVKLTKRKSDRAGGADRGGRGGRGGGSPPPQVPGGSTAPLRLSDVAFVGIGVVAVGGLKVAGLCPAELCSGGIVDTAVALGGSLGGGLAAGWRYLRQWWTGGGDEPSPPPGGGSGRGGGGRGGVVRLRPSPSRGRRKDRAAKGGPTVERQGDGEATSAATLVIPSMWPPIEPAGRPRDAD